MHRPAGECSARTIVVFLHGRIEDLSPGLLHRGGTDQKTGPGVEKKLGDVNIRK